MITNARIASVFALVGLTVLVVGQSGPCGGDSGDTDGRSVSNDTNPTDVAPATLGGTVDVANLVIPAGQTTTVTSDLVVNATGNVTIDGQLIASPSGGTGGGITILADGDITIGGTVQAGDGDAASSTQTAAAMSIAANGDAGSGTSGHNGGTVQIKAAGNLSIVEGAMISAGNGSNGTSGRRGGAGGDGGSVILLAGGQLRMRGSVHVGDGGNGGDATTNTSDRPLIFGNRGGDSGFLYVGAASYDWPGLTEVPSPKDSSLHLMLDLFSVTAPTGGVGGVSGSVAVQDDPVECVVPSTTIAREADGDAVYMPAQEGPGAIVGTVYFSASAARGGHGWALSGNGGTILLQSCAHDGRDGLSWTVRAGDAGNVTERSDPSVPSGAKPVVISWAHAGFGGIATALAAPGVMGDGGHPTGGKGGSLQVFGGRGGNGEYYANHFGGDGGRAQASAGFGGAGVSHECEDPGHGGDGGDGGDAEAQGGDGGNGVTPGKGGEAVPQAGDVPSIGGDGGHGVPGAGQPGRGGELIVATGADGASQPNAIVGTLSHSSRAADGNPGTSFELEWCQQ